jgi:pimeloyl-ACP methyl ester carboxylesterase
LPPLPKGGSCVARLPLWQAIQQQNHRRWFPPFDAGRWDFYLDRAGRTPIRTLAERGAMLLDWDVRNRLREIDTPVLLIRGEGVGRVSAGDHDELAAGLSCARTEWLDSAGHLPFLTHPHRLGKLMREFFAEVES